jgi:hypothetical protein
VKVFAGADLEVASPGRRSDGEPYAKVRLAGARDVRVNEIIALLVEVDCTYMERLVNVAN